MSIETPEAAIKKVSIPDERPGRGRATVVEGITESSEDAGGSEEADDDEERHDDAEHTEDGEAGAGGDAGGDDEGEESGEEGAEGEPAADASESDVRDDDPKPAPKSGAERRIAGLLKQQAAKDTQIAEQAAKIAAFEASRAGGEDAPKLYTEAEVQARIKGEASKISEVEQINGKLDTMFEAGVKAHKDFEQRVQAYGQAFGPDLANRVDFFTAVSDLDNGADVLHALGGDLDRMADILDLPPARMGIALANLSAKLAAPKPKPLSKAPAPIKPLESTTKSAKSIWDKDISQDEHVRIRREARAARAASRQ